MCRARARACVCSVEWCKSVCIVSHPVSVCVCVPRVCQCGCVSVSVGDGGVRARRCTAAGVCVSVSMYAAPRS